MSDYTRNSPSSPEVQITSEPHMPKPKQPELAPYERDEPFEISFSDGRKTIKAFVVFAHDYVETLPNMFTSQVLTTCIITTLEPLNHFGGITLKNPNDHADPEIGYQVAFRRAVANLWSKVGPREVEEAWFTRNMRQKLYEARKLEPEHE